MLERVTVDGLSVDAELHRFVEDELLPDLGMSSAQFWEGLETLFVEFSDRNAELLRHRDQLQRQIGCYHHSAGGALEPVGYQSFLREIGYLAPEPEAFEIDTTGVDPEIATIAGPQQIVPILNVLLAARALLLEGQTQPSGYTEPILHERRLGQKNSVQTTRET